MPSDFERDDKWQRSVRDRILIPQFYDRLGCHFIMLDGTAPLFRDLQKHGVDTLCRWNGHRVALFEEKIVRWPGRYYTAFSLETESCTVEGREKPGWMRYGTADELLYCFALDELPTALGVYRIPFQPLRNWFSQHETEFPKYGPLPTLNRTAGRVVPIKAVQDNVDNVRFLLLEAARAA